MKRYEIIAEDNFDSKKINTQINLLEKLIVFVISLTAIGFMVLFIESIKDKTIFKKHHLCKFLA